MPMTMLNYLAKGEFERILSLDCNPVERASLFADACRINTLYMISHAGSGHIGSSFSSLDIVAWLFLEEMCSNEGSYIDVYFSSKGHDAPGLYAALAGVGVIPFEAIHRLRRLGGLPGHPDIATPGIVANTGSLGMGISKAKGMAIANRLNGVDSRIYVMTGDGELQEGQFWESLISATNMGLSEITVIIDHNKLQSDIWVHQTSDLGDLETKLISFGWHVQRVDGHNGLALGSAFAEARNEKDRPSVIVADTIKGKGISFMQHHVSSYDRSLYKFHSGAPAPEIYAKGFQELADKLSEGFKSLGLNSPIYQSESWPEKALLKKPQHLPSAYAKALVAQGEQRADIVVLDADLKLDCGLIPFEDRFPKRFIECGIAEQDMVSMAGGLALKGLLPVAHSFACFLSTRPNEQIYNNATERTKIIYTGFLAGVLPSGPGHSHQSVRDISALGSVPQLSIIQPSCEEEVVLALDWCVNQSAQSSFLRIAQIPCEISFKLPVDYVFEPGTGVVLKDGVDVVAIAYGPVLLQQAWRAAEMLESNGISVRLVNLPWLNIIKQDWLSKVISGCRAVFFIDDHYVKGGQGEMLAAAIGEMGTKVMVHRLGIHDVPVCGGNEEVLQHHGLDDLNVAQCIIDKLRIGS